jgi:hypothetical protein
MLMMPFGKHKDKPLSAVPADYLNWLLRACKLSPGLRTAVTAELRSRGQSVPEPPPPKPLPACDRCGPVGAFAFWFEDTLGRRRIRAECRRCHRMLGHPPCVEPYVTMANANASETPLLDALVRLDELGVDLVSDGRRVDYANGGWRKVPADLNAVVKSCSHRLARMLGDTRPRPPKEPR